MDDIRELFSEALRAANGDYGLAKKRVRRRLKQEVKLYDKVAWPLVESAIDSHIDQTMRNERRNIRFSIMGQSGSAPNEPRVGGDAIRRSAKSSLYFWPLANGLRLGEATKQDIQDNISMRIPQVIGALANLRFLRSIDSALIKFGVRVDKAIPEGRLESMLAASRPNGGADEEEIEKPAA